MSTFVLLPGAFRGAWSWSPVVTALERVGHSAVAVDLVGQSDRGRDDMSLDLLLDRTREAVVSTCQESGEAIVLVGHSFGGLVAVASAGRCSGDLEAVVAVDAPMPRDGQRAIDLRPAGVPEPDLDRTTWLAPRPVTAGDGLTRDQAAWINEHLGPEPVGPSLDVIELDDRPQAGPPIVHLFFDRTPARHPVRVTRPAVEGSGAAWRSLDAGHDGIVSHPEDVAAALVELVDG